MITLKPVGDRYQCHLGAEQFHPVMAMKPPAHVCAPQRDSLETDAGGRSYKEPFWKNWSNMGISFKEVVKPETSAFEGISIYSNELLTQQDH